MKDFLETESGHVITCLLLMIMGAVFIKIAIPEGRDLIVFGLGVLGRSMGTKVIAAAKKEPEPKENPPA